MSSFEPKKLALIRILQILQKHSDFNHPLTHEDIGMMLENEYGIIIERKAVGRNLSLLKEAGFDIESKRNGSYLESRDFDDAELRMLIDGVLSSKYITANHSKDLIERFCGLSNRYFRSHIKNIYSVNDWSKTDNQALFLNIELVDEAIEQVRQIHYDYNKYGLDKKLHKSSYQRVSPYQLILHNQRYYLMGYSDYWGNRCAQGGNLQNLIFRKYTKNSGVNGLAIFMSHFWYMYCDNLFLRRKYPCKI